MKSNNNFTRNIYFFAGILFISYALVSGKYALVLLGVCCIVIGSTMGKL